MKHLSVVLNTLTFKEPHFINGILPFLSPVLQSPTSKTRTEDNRYTGTCSVDGRGLKLQA